MPGENATGGGGAVRRHNATSSIEEAPSPIAESNSPPTPRRMVPTEENTESEEYSFQEKVLLFICVCILFFGIADLETHGKSSRSYEQFHKLRHHALEFVKPAVVYTANHPLVNQIANSAAANRTKEYLNQYYPVINEYSSRLSNTTHELAKQYVAGVDIVLNHTAEGLGKLASHPAVQNIKNSETFSRIQNSTKSFMDGLSSLPDHPTIKKFLRGAGIGGGDGEVVPELLHDANQTAPLPSKGG